MIFGFALLAITYLGLVLAVLALALRAPAPAWTKTLLILVLGAGMFLSYEGWVRLAGWPSDTALPERFLYHAAVVTEPDPDLGVAGKIELWATAIGPDGPAARPRAYLLAYSRPAHNEVQAAQERLRTGSPQIGQSLGNGLGRGGVGSLDQESPFQLSTVPEPALPEK